MSMTSKMVGATVILLAALIFVINNETAYNWMIENSAIIEVFFSAIFVIAFFVGIREVRKRR